MAQFPTAEPFLPAGRSLTLLAEAASACRGCDLWQRATQVVFGEGTERARIVAVGEQPGDREDVEGAPFVGPAGSILDEALTRAGIDRSLVYVTNAVKHFKWRERGKRRIHDRPSWSQITACRPWLLAEIEAIGPQALVLMGATAAQSLLGRDVRVRADRGLVEAPALAPMVVVTVHPSAILRGEPEAREQELEALAADLRLVAALA